MSDNKPISSKPNLDIPPPRLETVTKGEKINKINRVKKNQKVSDVFDADNLSVFITSLLPTLNAVLHITP